MNLFATSEEYYSNRFRPPIWIPRLQPQMTQIFSRIEEEIKNGMVKIRKISGRNELCSQLDSLLEAVMIARNSQENEAIIISLLQKAMEGFLDSNTVIEDHKLLMLYKGCYLLVPKGLQDMRSYGPHWTSKHVTRILIHHRGDNKYNFELVDLLVSCQLIDLKMYDPGLVQLMEGGVNSLAVTFAMDLVQCYCIDRGIQSFVSVIDLSSTIKALTLIAAKPCQAPEGLTMLIKNLNQAVGNFGVLDLLQGDPNAIMQTSISQARSIDDTPLVLREKTEFMLSEWVNMCHLKPFKREIRLAFSAFMRQAYHLQMLQRESQITHFFHLCTKMCVDMCYRKLSEQSCSPDGWRAECYFTLEAYVSLLVLLVKHSGGVENTETKINLLNKVLGIVAGVLLRDHEVMQTSFQELPYHRILNGLFIKLSAEDPILEHINFQVLTTFCNLLRALKPTNTPRFANAWLEIVSHRVFMDRMLVHTPEQKSWEMYSQLLIDLFKFLSESDKNDCLVLHKSTLKVLRVLLRDFPEFLCEYHYEFCDAMLPHCIQMRNLISCAIPRKISVPDAFTPDLKVDMLPEVRQPPHISTSFVKMIETRHFKKRLDSYLRKGSPAKIFPKLLRKLLSNDPICRFNVPLMNAIVLYVGTQAIECINSKGLTPSLSTNTITITNSRHSGFFYNFIYALDYVGRHLLFTAICNQLTYPNSHTHYFSCLLQYLFLAVYGEGVHQQIARVVLERLAFKPYPWGLLITAIELMKNPVFEFFARDYINCSPQIEKALKPMAQEYEMLKLIPTTNKPKSEKSKSNPTTDEPEMAEKQPKSNPTTDELKKAEKQPKSNPTTYEPEMVEKEPESNPTTDEPEMAEKQPESYPTTDELKKAEKQPKSNPTTDEPEMVEKEPESNPTTDEPEMAEKQPKSNPTTDEPEKAEKQPESNLTTDEPKKAEEQPKSNLTTDEPEKAEQQPKSNPTTDELEKAEKQPESNPTTDELEKAEQQPKSNPTTDEPEMAKKQPKSNPTTDELEKAKKQPKSNPTIDEPEKAEKQPESNPTIDEIKKAEKQPESNPTIDELEKAKKQPKSNPTTDEPEMVEKKPESNPTNDEPEMAEKQSKSNHTTDEPEKAEKQPKSNPTTDEPEKAEQQPKSNPTTDELKKAEKQPESNPTTDELEKAEQQPKSNPTTDEPEMAKKQPKSNPTIDELEKAKKQPKSNPTIDEPEKAEKQPESNPTIDELKKAEKQPESNPTIDELEKAEKQPKSNPTTDEPEMVEKKPESNPTNDEPEMAEKQSKSNHTTDEPEMAKKQLKSNPTTDEPEKAEKHSESNLTTDEPKKAEEQPKSNLSTDEPEKAEKQPESNPTTDELEG